MYLKGCSPIGYKAIFIQNMEKSSSERSFIRYISKHSNHSLKVHLIGISPYTDIGKHLQEYHHTTFLSFSPNAFFLHFHHTDSLHSFPSSSARWQNIQSSHLYPIPLCRTTDDKYIQHMKVNIENKGTFSIT